MNQLRILWWVSALLVSAVLLVRIGAPVALGQDATPAAVTAPAPDWTFVVHGMQDPYAGVLTSPGEPAPGMRYVGVDVEVVNASDQPLSFAGNAVSLRDDAGFSYRSGTVAGSEPALQGRALPGGERARGWVWFEVPEGATLTEILLVPAAPELRVGLDAVVSISSTPGAITTETAVVTPEPAATEPVTPMATEPPATDETTTAAPAATLAPTSVIIIEGADTPEGGAPATATPAATAPPAATSTPAVKATPAIVTSAPTAPAPSAPAAESGIEPGSTVITADSDANLRDGPSLDAAIISTVPLGSELAVTGPAVIGDDFVWWPVTVVATGEEGFVAEELLTPLDE